MVKLFRSFRIVFNEITRFFIRCFEFLLWLLTSTVFVLLIWHPYFLDGQSPKRNLQGILLGILLLLVFLGFILGLAWLFGNFEKEHATHAENTEIILNERT